jgi:transcriptional regulator with XRE-family HTH domain
MAVSRTASPTVQRFPVGVKRQFPGVGMAWVRAGNIAERMADLRGALELTQEEMAAQAGVRYTAVSEWETAKARPPKGRLEALARRLGIPVTVFQEGGPMPSTLVNRLTAARSPGPASMAGSRAEARFLEALRELTDYAQRGESVPASVAMELLAGVWNAVTSRPSPTGTAVVADPTNAAHGFAEPEVRSKRRKVLEAKRVREAQAAALEREKAKKRHG